MKEIVLNDVFATENLEEITNCLLSLQKIGYDSLDYDLFNARLVVYKFDGVKRRAKRIARTNIELERLYDEDLKERQNERIKKQNERDEKNERYKKKQRERCQTIHQST